MISRRGETGRLHESVIASLCCCVSLAACSRGPVELGFWIELVSYQSPRIGDPITATELATIDTIARDQISKAFTPFDIVVSANRGARYSVRVVPEVKDERLQRGGVVAGASRGIPGFGGSGAVNFAYVANGAMVFSPETASRAEVIEALGRGIGRVAIHEAIHQLLPKAPIHDSRDSHSYEGNSPALVEGYFGDLHWGIAEPWLEERIGKRQRLH
jgi:hypothetical protein